MLTIFTERRALLSWCAIGCCWWLQGLEWEFAVINEPTVNAFVVPGGKVVFYTGLLRLLETKDEIAAILGHEAAHVVARHTVSSLEPEEAAPHCDSCDDVKSSLLQGAAAAAGDQR